MSSQASRRESVAMSNGFVWKDCEGISAVDTLGSALGGTLMNILRERKSHSECGHDFEHRCLGEGRSH